MMRFAGVVAACAVSACVMPLTDERAPFSAESRSRGWVALSDARADVQPEVQGDSRANVRERAARHAQLSLAYLRHARADVGHAEALAAWRLTPDDVGIVHLLALSEAALGRSSAALDRFAEAVKLDDEASHVEKVANRVANRVANKVANRASDGVMLAGRQAGREGVRRHQAHEQSLSAAQGAIKELSERAILWSNYAVALEAAGQRERAACFFGRMRDSLGGAYEAGNPCLE